MTRSLSDQNPICCSSTCHILFTLRANFSSAGLVFLSLSLSDSMFYGVTLHSTRKSYNCKMSVNNAVMRSVGINDFPVTSSYPDESWE